MPSVRKRKKKGSISINQKSGYWHFHYLLLAKGQKSAGGNNYHEINGKENLIQRGKTHFGPEGEVRWNRKRRFKNIRLKILQANAVGMMTMTNSHQLPVAEEACVIYVVTFYLHNRPIIKMFTILIFRLIFNGLEGLSNFYSKSYS